MSALIIASILVFPVLAGCSTARKAANVNGPITVLPMEMVVKITDLDGEDWDWISGLPVPEYDAEHAYQVEFVRNASTPDGQERVFSKTAVYPSIDKAQSAFTRIKENSMPSGSPDIGDEAFLDTSPVMKGTGLVFRKANVVAWISVNHGYQGDIRRLGTIIEDRITRNIPEK